MVNLGTYVLYGKQVASKVRRVSAYFLLSVGMFRHARDRLRPRGGPPLGTELGRSATW